MRVSLILFHNNIIKKSWQQIILYSRIAKYHQQVIQDDFLHQDHSNQQKRIHRRMPSCVGTKSDTGGYEMYQECTTVWHKLNK